MKHLRLLGSLLSGIILSLVFASVAHAATFTVDDTGDASAVDPSVSCDTAGNVCTLRSAIEAANAQAGADTIDFNIAGSGVHTITPASALPAITEQVTIDGSTQPGASCGTLVPASLPNTNTPHNLLIELDMSNSSALSFLNGSDFSIARGLVLNNIGGSSQGMSIDSTVGDVTVECNYFGTNASGDTVVGGGWGILAFTNSNTNTIQNNLFAGFEVAVIATSTEVKNNLIGTTASGIGALPNLYAFVLIGGQNVTITHNIVSGNYAHGILMDATNNITIKGNYIGLNIAGNPLGNGSSGSGYAGISAKGANNFTIGGTNQVDRNIISANTGDGIHIYNDCSYPTSIGSTIYGNYIGTNASGTVVNGYGNTAAGIEVNEYYGGCNSVYKHQIGGDNTGEPNIIAGNTNQGILIHQGGPEDVFSITTFGNSVYANGQFGIDIASDSDIDTGIADTDLGPNLLNNYLMSLPTNGYANYYLNRPTITSVNFSGNQLTLNYSFQANQADNTSLFQTDVVGYRLDFYINDAGKDGAYDGYSQGKTHLGSFIVNGSETNASHTFTSPVTLQDGQTVSATTTVLWNNIPQSVCNTNPDAYYGNGVPYNSCTPPQP